MKQEDIKAGRSYYVRIKDDDWTGRSTLYGPYIVDTIEGSEGQLEVRYRDGTLASPPESMPLEQFAKFVDGEYL